MNGSSLSKTFSWIIILQVALSINKVIFVSVGNWLRLLLILKPSVTSSLAELRQTDVWTARQHLTGSEGSLIVAQNLFMSEIWQTFPNLFYLPTQ